MASSTNSVVERVIKEPLGRPRGSFFSPFLQPFLHATINHKTPFYLYSFHYILLLTLKRC
uniref:Uncharacterized protein n=1 Tax=Magnetococcus massalia (strain MO-1) TaxID=451514 RepID=A0A1S7LG12_MAGMO|nr:protein of unknown function [Candidatus Magnetococcus massalia]